MIRYLKIIIKVTKLFISSKNQQYSYKIDLKMELKKN